MEVEEEEDDEDDDEEEEELLLEEEELLLEEEELLLEEEELLLEVEQDDEGGLAVDAASICAPFAFCAKGTSFLPSCMYLLLPKNLRFVLSGFLCFLCPPAAAAPRLWCIDDCLSIAALDFLRDPVDPRGLPAFLLVIFAGVLFTGAFLRAFSFVFLFRCLPIARVVCATAETNDREEEGRVTIIIITNTLN
jgi:hypothetical protein